MDSYCRYIVMAIRAQMGREASEFAALMNIQPDMLAAWESGTLPITPTELYYIASRVGLDFGRVMDAYDPDQDYDYFFSAVEFGVCANALSLKKKIALFDLAHGVSGWTNGLIFAA